MALDTDYDKLLQSLESQELDAPNGVPPDVVYEKMMAIYLLNNDIMSAKMLWKRIPVASKVRCPVLEQLWGVGRQLFTRDRAAVFHTISSNNWPPHLQVYMDKLTESYRERSIRLISQAYSSIGLEDVAKLLGLEQAQLLPRLESLGWTIEQDSQMVLPKPIPKSKIPHMPSEKQLERLTQYVSFLEVGL